MVKIADIYEYSGTGNRVVITDVTYAGMIFGKSDKKELFTIEALSDDGRKFMILPCALDGFVLITDKYVTLQEAIASPEFRAHMKSPCEMTDKEEKMNKKEDEVDGSKIVSISNSYADWRNLCDLIDITIGDIENLELCDKLIIAKEKIIEKNLMGEKI